MAKGKSVRRYHHGELREALVETGRVLLAEKGVSGFTLRECARRTGVSHAAPAHHFKSSGDLLAEIAARGFEALSAAMQARADATSDAPATRLRALGQGYVDFAIANGAVFHLMFTREACAFRNERLAEAGARAYGQLVSSVDALIPVADPVVKAAMVQFAWSCVHGLAMLILHGQIDRDAGSAKAAAQRHDRVLTSLVEAIAARG